MKLEHSTAVDLALRKALALGQDRGVSQVELRSLLHALVDEDEGQAIMLLEAAGVDRPALRQQFPSVTLDSGLVLEDEIPLAAATREILRQARELARLHAAEGTVSSDFVLLALVEHDDNARALLESLGLDVGNLRERIAPQGPPLVLNEPLDYVPPAESIDAARILDAAANRAREGLRVLEDYCRFVLDDAFLTAQLKKLRHDLAAALGELPARLLLAARTTLADVGTSLTTPSEQERSSFRAVAQANAKRLQEALRSLEEFGKMASPTFGLAIEQLRYQAYSLEQAILQGADARTRLADARLYVLVTEEMCKHSLAGTVRDALAGGADVIQLREKKLDDKTLLDRARDLRRLTRAADAIFIVNDRPDIALLVEADGVHLGQDDLPIREARRLLGPDALIGVSTHDLDQVRRAVLEGASYVGVGPTFPSQTKDFANFPGLDFVRQAAQETSLPAFVLGGVTLDNVPQVLAAGGQRVAVSAAICAAADPRAAAARLRALLQTSGP